MTPVRVLFISGSYPPIKCGVGDYTALLAKELAKFDNLVVGVLTGSEVADADPASSVRLLPLITSWRLDGVVNMLRAVRCWRPDIVHIQYPTRGYGKGKMPLLLPMAFGMMGLRVVQTWHEPLGWLRSLRYLPCAVTRDALVVVEPDYASLVPRWFSAVLRRKLFCRYIPVGSNIPSFSLTKAQKNTLRAAYAADDVNLVAYFGFASPLKGIDVLFEIADPVQDHLLLICELDDRHDAYHDYLQRRIEAPDWNGKVSVTGYRDSDGVAALLACADIAVFPFLNGVTGRNASVLAARNQGTFVITSSQARHGYYESENCYYTRPGDLDDMRQALRSYSGRRCSPGGVPEWQVIAASHAELYVELQQSTTQED